MTTIQSYDIHGIEFQKVEIQCEISEGIGIHIVGISDEQVQAALMTVATALDAQGWHIPGKKIIIYVKAEKKIAKAENIHLPIALSMLAEAGFIKSDFKSDMLIAGQVDLVGNVHGVPGAYTALLYTIDNGGYEGAIFPCGLVQDCAALVDKIPVYDVKTIGEAISVLRSGRESGCLIQDRHAEYFAEKHDKGQPTKLAVHHSVMHALQAAVAGGFNIFLRGSNKYLVEQALEVYRQLLVARADYDTVAKIYSSIMVPIPKQGVPMRHPRASASLPALLGGGPDANPGLVTLAHGGVMVIKEPEAWPKSNLEAVSEAQKRGEVTIRRLDRTVTYPSKMNLALVAGDDITGEQYWNIIDTMHGINAVHITIPQDEHLMEIHDKALTAARENIAYARETGLGRYDKETSKASFADLYPDEKTQDIVLVTLEQMGEKPTKARDLLCLARTFADLDASPDIERQHVDLAARHIRFKLNP